jgi:hypothetical protein
MMKTENAHTGPSLAVLYYNTILKGQYWYYIGVLAKMCNTGDYVILTTEIFVCNTEENMMQYQENLIQNPNKMLCIIKFLAYTY